MYACRHLYDQKFHSIYDGCRNPNYGNSGTFRLYLTFTVIVLFENASLLIMRLMKTTSIYTKGMIIEWRSSVLRLIAIVASC